MFKIELTVKQMISIMHKLGSRIDDCPFQMNVRSIFVLYII